MNFDTGNNYNNIGYKYGREGQLEVVRWHPNAFQKHYKKLEVVCHKCSANLGVETVYYLSPKEVGKNMVPCRCKLTNPFVVTRTTDYGGYDDRREGHLYVLKIRGKDDSFTGFGITGELETRMSVHTKNLANKGYMVEDSVIFAGDGKVIKAAESMLKETLEITKTPVTGFRTEATFGHMFQAVAEKIKNFLWGDGKYQGNLSYI